MRVFLGSPNTQQQAEHAAGMDVLISFAIAGKSSWLFSGGYLATYRDVLVDSGAYSEFNSGKPIDLGAYRAWAEPLADQVCAVAGLDDIRGDWRKSLANYEAFPLGFPTIHETDPPELLDDLIPMARERCGWIGLGLLPPREGKERIVRSICDRIPDDLHVHGWALRAYTHVGRVDSTDSTNWWRDAMKLRTLPDTAHLTYGECLEIVVKRYQRWRRVVKDDRRDHPAFVFAGEA